MAKNGLKKNHSVLSSNLLGVLYIMLGRSEGLYRIDTSNKGLSASFMGLVFMMLLDASALSIQYDLSNIADSDASPSKFAFIFLNVIIVLISYGTSMTALYFLSATKNQPSRFPIAVIVHNWAAAVVSFLFYFLVFFQSNGSSDAIAPLSMLIVLLAVGLLILIDVRLIRISLNVELSKATLLFILTSAVSMICNEGVSAVFNLAP